MRASLQFDELDRLLEQTLETGTQSPKAVSALDCLERESFLVQELFADNPSMAVTGELFDLAERLTLVGLRLARHFQRTGEIDLEERAWHLRHDTMHTARAHQRNVMGPIILDWADCNRRLGRHEKADSLYDSVVNDFSTILGWGPTFNADWIEAVKSLQKALALSSKNYGDLSNRVDTVLAQSEELRNQQAAGVG